MTVQIGDIVRAVLSYTHPNASIAQNVFTWELTDAAADEDDLLADLSAWASNIWGGAWDALSAVDCELFLVEVDLLNGDGTVMANIGSDVFSIPGTNDVDVASPAVSGYIQAESTRTKSLGKKYLPFITEESITDGIIVTAAMVHLAALFGIYVDPLALTVTGILVPGVLSRITETFQEFTGSGYTTDVPAYQRRRKPGVGS